MAYQPDLRPGNRGIGVSVAVGTRSNGDKLQREVIRPLQVRDAAGVSFTLEPGSILTAYQIVPDRAGREVYLMEFDSSGRRYRCPLVQFQPRTKSLPPDKMEECAPPASSKNSELVP